MRSFATDESATSIVPINGLDRTRIPAYARYVLHALRLSNSAICDVPQLNDAQWRKLLKFCDRSQLTLLLGELAWDTLPPQVRDRIAGSRRTYAIRFEKLKSEYREICEALEARNIEFVTVKGFAHSPDFTPDPLTRQQGDIDLWFPPEDVYEARDVLLDLGYVEHGRIEARHLAPLSRPRAWEWRGDFFASDLPNTVELHYRLWDDAQSAMASFSEHEFWMRREHRVIDGLPVTVLCSTDAIGFAALHLLMHVLRGDLRLQRAWEIANFLHIRQLDEGFWRTWRERHPPALRRPEAVVFSLTAAWFGGAVSSIVAAEIAQLPDDIGLWLTHYTWSPVENLFHPNKDELWLHIAMLSTLKSKLATLAVRIFPVAAIAIPGAIESAVTASSFSERVQSLKFLCSRFVRHIRIFLPTLGGGVRWWWLRLGLGKEFVTYQAASVLFNFGAFIFVLLHNLYILQRGYHEDVIGQLQSAMTAGTLVAALPAAVLARRKGLRTALLVAIVGGALSMAVRVTADSMAALLASAFLNGAFFSIWAVTLPPAVAGYTTVNNRARAFSIVSSLGIAVGVVASFVGGRLPGLFAALHHSTRLQNERFALLAGAALLATAAIPTLMLTDPVSEPRGGMVYPKGRFIMSFLLVMAVWSFGMAAFNPFANAYFAVIRHMTDAAIGTTFSLAQAFQVTGILAAPMLLKRLGRIKGIALTQLVASSLLVCLGLFTGSALVPMVYMFFMCFQYASEPGLFDLLMSGVRPLERSGASALYFIVVSVTASLAALVSGRAVAMWGYSAVLPVAGVIGASAAALLILFAASLRKEPISIASAPRGSK